MIKVTMKDVALVAFSGGLLAFELVSLGEALPDVRKALADRGHSDQAFVATAHATAAPAPAAETEVAQALLGSVASHAPLLASASAKASAKRCAVVTRAKSRQRAHVRVRDGIQVVTIEGSGSCAHATLAQSQEKMKKVQKAFDLAVKQGTL